MTAPTVTERIRNGHRVDGCVAVGERVELGRYTVPPAGERIIFGQRVNGVVRLVDVPRSGHGRAFLIERELEQDGLSALQALVADYLSQAARLGDVPMAVSPLGRFLDHLP
jgi:hypothetical protein